MARAGTDGLLELSACLERVSSAVVAEPPRSPRVQLSDRTRAAVRLTSGVIDFGRARLILTRQQIQGLELLSRGVVATAIVTHLAISQKTVNRHLEDIRARVGADNRGAILHCARGQRSLVLNPAARFRERRYDRARIGT